MTGGLPLKLLQINCDLNWGSIGRIAEGIGILAQKQGWEPYLIYGRDKNTSSLNEYKLSNILDVYEHYAEYRLIDNDGLASRAATRKVIKKIEEINPDIIHLHNIHDHWLNYNILFQYLITTKVPLVWTQHDCWSFTGGCGYYSLIDCKKWEKECDRCPLKHGLFPLVDKTNYHFNKKKELFNSVSNLTLVPVSKWLEGEIRRSFLNSVNVRQIYNGVDITVFKPIDNKYVKEKLNIGGRKLLVAAATSWSERKGLKDYITLSRTLRSDEVIVLVGLSGSQLKHLPSKIIGLSRTQDVNELVHLYSAADIVLNLSYEETFGLTTVEGFACGTPGIVYNSTASPELITPETGLVVEAGDIEGVATAVHEILKNGKDHYAKACRERAVKFFNKDDRFADYIKLYEELLNERKKS